MDPKREIAEDYDDLCLSSQQSHRRPNRNENSSYSSQIRANTCIHQHNCSTWNNCVGGYRCWRGFAKNSYCFRCDLGADAIVGLTGISHRNLLQFLSLDPCKFEGFVAALRYAGTSGGPRVHPPPTNKDPFI